MVSQQTMVSYSKQLFVFCFWHTCAAAAVYDAVGCDEHICNTQLPVIVLFVCAVYYVKYLYHHWYVAASVSTKAVWFFDGRQGLLINIHIFMWWMANTRAVTLYKHERYD